MSQSRVSRLLSGRQRLCVDDVIDLSHAVGVRPMEVLESARKRLGRLARHL